MAVLCLGLSVQAQTVDVNVLIKQIQDKILQLTQQLSQLQSEAIDPSQDYCKDTNKGCASFNLALTNLETLSCTAYRFHFRHGYSFDVH